ncbi:AAA family ATPase [Parapedobacter indicus]|uniref:Exonuclease SbcC n=1 Tax=Parapedobacter indicus TaxID=1477437 RepID=A0A1I3IT85_9SPHI|nr:AAA family ATPase [Parapedobacter indicus]PPL02283.1 exonuclease SbcC [Parapedobacter indicus]SFI51155.1 exonuclease SbcC [Parapedobacter indicus]
MKILAIRIKNLASLEGTTEIDFTQEPLCSAGIFAITGPTGAGKSTILDALCLALYAKTPRYAQAREIGIEITDVQGSTINQSDVRAILRDGTAEGYAEVDFVGIDGRHYRATWSVRRARNRVDGSLQQASTTLRNLTTGSDIGGKKTELLPEITRLVGLNYEQFIRSVLLAQGDFTAFLKADKDQKASLLEKLTGTHIYSELSKKVYERCREEEEQLKLLQQRQEGIAILTTEELADLKAREADLAKTLDQLQTQIDATAKEIKWHDDLSHYQAQVNEAQHTLTERLAEKAQSAERETYLRQVEQVQPVRTSVDLYQEATERLIQRKQTSGEISSQQQLLAQQVNDATAAVTEATQHLEAQTSTLETAKPQLAEAAKLDIQLHAQQADLSKAQEQLQARQAKWAGSKQRLADKQQEADTLERQIETHRQWIDKRADRQPVAEHHTLIVAKLAEARKQLDTIDRAANDIARYEAQIQAKTTEHAEAIQRSENLAKQLNDAQAEVIMLRKDLTALPVSQLREESKALAAQLEALFAATALWRQLYRAQQDAQQQQQKIEDHKLDLKAKEIQLQDTDIALQAITEQRKASAAMLEKAMVAASADVETLRSQLTDGQPCPVCGSETHPYAHENPKLNHVLDELRKAHDAIEHTYSEHVAGHGQLSQAVPLLRQTIEQLDGEFAAKRSELDEHTRQWEQYAISQACADIEPAHKDTWLVDHAQKLTAAQGQVSKQLDQHQHSQDTLDQLQQTLQRLQAEHTASADAVKDLAHHLQTLKERLTNAKEEHTSGNANLEAILAAIQPHFPDDQWIASWKSQHEAFLQSVNKFAAEWKKTTEALDADRNNLKVSQATLTGIQKEEQDLAAEVTLAERDYADKQAILETFRASRLSLFNGEAVETIEARLKQRITEAQEQLNAKKQSQERLQIEKAQLDATAKETQHEITRLEKRAAELSGKIEQWLTDYSAKQQSRLDQATLQKLLTHPAEWIAEEREALSAIERAVTQATSVLDERTRQLTQHEQQRPSDEPLDTLQQRLQEQQASKLESQRDHNEIGFRLKQDESNKRQLGDLLATIQAKQLGVDNWSKLNDIIGSADGKKFRQVAQEYTLDVLLNYANVHLEVLSKRYRLQRIPNTLGLQVLDQDMGDEVRTVYSLSGGESFLVSLALALGLASLSASRMNVESLFIDEGFGSLDPNTLNIAMDALERLHNQGRKVGVISHVQEMTERIPVQIKVDKGQSGRSRAEVVGL